MEPRSCTFHIPPVKVLESISVFASIKNISNRWYCHVIISACLRMNQLQTAGQIVAEVEVGCCFTIHVHEAWCQTALVTALV